MAKEKVKSELLAALDFVRNVTKSEESAIVTMADHMLSVVTRYMRAYHPVRDDMRFSTDLEKYHAAIKTIGDRPYQATVDKTIKVNAGRFKVELPLLNETDVPPLNTEGINIPCSPDFLQALYLAATPTTPGHTRVAFAGVYLTPEATFVGTNGSVMVEAWHGNRDIHSNIIIPTDFIRILERMTKAGRVATHMWADDYIFAIRYDDGAILITQLYVEQYVNYSGVFDLFTGTTPSKDNLETLKAALDELAPFGALYRVSASSIDCGNASVTMPSEYSWCIRVPDWQMVKHIVLAFDPHTRPNMACFIGPTLRGVIIKVDEDAANRLSHR